MLRELTGIKIVLGICGSIAAYKAAYLVRELCTLGAEVRVIMTQGALAFIQPMTLQALSGEDVRYDLFDTTAERAMGHIELARWADYLLIAPASADFMAKMAHGLADDLLSTVYLATNAPVMVCPAMNRHMWLHPATVTNCNLLKARGVIMIGPEDGEQACGDIGLGRMAETETILAHLYLSSLQQTLEGHRFIITAGPTQEAIDPVRYISNKSSGKMGYALAKAAVIAGAQVILISGPTHLAPPMGVKRIQVMTAKEMLAAVLETLELGMIFIGTAAVADYYVEQPAPQKLKKQGQDTLNLTLKKNPDILAAVVASHKASMVIGFAAETHAVLENAKEKLRAKQVDMVVANQVGHGLGFDSDVNQVTVLTQQTCITFDLAPKIILAGQIIAMIAECLQQPSRNVNEQPIYSD